MFYITWTNSSTHKEQVKIHASTIVINIDYRTSFSKHTNTFMYKYVFVSIYKLFNYSI